MAPSRLLLALLAAALATACGGDEAPAPPASVDTGSDACQPGELALDDGRCLAAGMQENGCAAGEVGLEGGGCRPAGIPPEMCAEGFTPDGEMGCIPILPAEPCPKGLMAVPGETLCREIAPCAAGTWGDIPIEADTEHVDGSYAGGGSDGTAQKPWTTIQAGITAAAPGAIVAVAAGSYVEDVSIQGKPVRLWGRCPASVEIVGTAGAVGAVFVRDGASGSQIRHLGVRGAAMGMVVSGSEDVAADRMWIHDTQGRGIGVQNDLGPTRIAVTSSLVEVATEFGVYVSGSAATIEASVVRDTQPRASDQALGRGITIRDDPDTAERASVTVRSSVVDRNHDLGVLVAGSDATIEASVVRDTQPQASDQAFGGGIAIQDDPDTAERASVTVRSSVIDRNHDVGVLVAGSDATVEASVVRDTQPRAFDQAVGRGISIENDLDTAERASVTVRSSVVDRNHEVGVFVEGSDATIEASVVRDTRPRPSDQAGGRGIGIEANPDTAERASVTVRSSVVDRNHEIGVVVLGSDATVEASVVRDTQPRAFDQALGRGIGVQHDPDTGARAVAAIRGSRVEHNRDVGISVHSSDAAVEATVVQGTQPRAMDGAYGDGVTAWAYAGAASAVVTGSRVEGSARAGVSSFGASVSVGTTLLECNGIDLDTEVYEGTAATWQDQGGNVCGCAGATVACQVTSTNLAPPEPLTQSDPLP